jgi:membrane-bound lytic murein transglycosylase D
MQFAGMTLTIRDDARREIQTDVDALTRSPKYFNIKAERARTYFPIIEDVFNQERLPVDFKFLALQESALVPDAVSSSNAVGFWQFKDFTAVEMGIRVDGEVDERMNIASASRAAARYIKQCNHYFNNWVYALQSYQMGAGGVMRAVGDKDLGTRHMEITSDTYWYVKKFLAHKVAFENVQGDPALKVTLVRNAGGKTMAQLSREYELDARQGIRCVVAKGRCHPRFRCAECGRDDQQSHNSFPCCGRSRIHGDQWHKGRQGEIRRKPLRSCDEGRYRTEQVP